MATDTKPTVTFLEAVTEDELRDQVTWLGEHAGLDRPFLARALRISEADLSEWHQNQDRLSFRHLGDLAAFWEVVCHLYQAAGRDEGRLVALLDHVVPLEFGPAGRALPPWKGGTLKRFLEGEGRDGFRAVFEFFAGHQD